MCINIMIYNTSSLQIPVHLRTQEADILSKILRFITTIKPDSKYTKFKFYCMNSVPGNFVFMTQ